MRKTLKITPDKTKKNDCEALAKIQTANKFCPMKLIAVLAIVLTISSLCLLKHIATARGDNTADSAGPAQEASFSNPLASGSVSSQGVEGMASNLVKEGQQFFQDPSKMLEYGGNPMGAMLKYFVPNTYQGVSSDLGNSFSMLANGANQGMNALQSGYGSLSGQLGNRFNAVQQNYLNRQEQALQQQEALLSRMYEIVSNPEQFCNQLGARRQQSSQQANQMMDQANKAASSFMNSLSSSFPMFG